MNVFWIVYELIVFDFIKFYFASFFTFLLSFSKNKYDLYIILANLDIIFLFYLYLTEKCLMLLYGGGEEHAGAIFDCGYYKTIV